MQTFAPSRFGAYQLTAHLGRGGMANVYLARRAGAAGFERYMVVKRILSDHHADPHFVQMFVNEAKIAAKLNHPNIVHIYELGEIDGEFFMAMEYVQGKDLLRLLRRLAKNQPSSPWLPPDAAAYIARELCRGLAHAHEYSEGGRTMAIVHRDVSPQNIMLAYDGQVKLVDFGIAKASDSLSEETRTGALKGKFAYMAPEQIDGLVPGPPTDVFALGIVLHEMLTGRRLFKGPTEFETMTRVRSMLVPPPSSLTTSGIARELDQIVLKALERDRSKRYARAADLVHDLDAFLAARFSMEKMATYMSALFPVEERTVDPTLTPAGGTIARPPRHPSEEPDNDTEGEGSPSPLGRSLSSEAALHLANGSAPKAPPGALTPPTGQSVPTIQTVPQRSGDTDPVAPRPVRTRPNPFRTALRLFLFALLATTGLLVAWSLNRSAAEAEPDPLLAYVDPAPVAPPPSAEPARTTLRVIAEPQSAQVYDGPKLAGSTPLDLPHRPGAVLTLERAGYEALRYTVQPEDGPILTLRMRAVLPPLPTRAQASKAGHAAPTRAVGAKPAAVRKPNVAVFDDDRPAPKVETVDD